MGDTRRINSTAEAAALAEWIASRPREVQDAIAQWPFGAQVILKGEAFRVIGWAETHDSHRSHDMRDLSLIVTPEVYYTDHDTAVAHKTYCCIRHLLQ